MIVRKDKYKPKGWFESFLDDTTFLEKIICLIWCSAMPFIIWMMCDSLELTYKIIITIGVWLLMTLCCYWFGKFMSERDWYY